MKRTKTLHEAMKAHLSVIDENKDMKGLDHVKISRKTLDDWLAALTRLEDRVKVLEAMNQSYEKEVADLKTASALPAAEGIDAT